VFLQIAAIKVAYPNDLKKQLKVEFEGSFDTMPSPSPVVF